MLLGPNCLGVFDATSDLGLASNEFPPGSIGLISQSGNLALELGILARAADMGFSRFASVGNQADLDLAELVASFAAHEGTELIAVYAEDFSDGRAFVDAAAAASTPVILLTVGRSDASIRAAVSHTGALVSDVSVVEAACRSAGAHLVSTPGEMIDLAQALLRARPLAGPRVAVIGDGGGHGAIACDVAATAGLDLPLLSNELAGRLAASLPHTAATRNPVDLAGGGEQDFFSYARVARAVLESGEIDAVLLTGYFGGYSQYSDEFAGQEADVAREVARAAEESGRPLVAQTMYADSPTAAVLRAGSVPVYSGIESAVAVLAALLPRPPAPGSPELPEQRPLPELDGYFGARALLEAAGIEFVAARSVPAGGDVEAAARRARLPGGREGPRDAPQVGCRRRRRRDRGPGRAAGGGRRPAPPPRPARLLGRARGARP